MFGNFTKSDNSEIARWFDGNGNMVELTWSPKASISRVKVFASDNLVADEVIVDDTPDHYDFFELGENLFNYYLS